jgi:hypothetical protein
MKTLAALTVLAATAAFAAFGRPSEGARVQYVPASDAEVAAAFAEAEASGELVRCVAAETLSGCAE